jgi:glutamate 5-kinase
MAPLKLRRVLKIGSSLLVEPSGRIRQEWLASLVADIAAHKAAGEDIVLVSSGAIALGAATLKLEKGGRASLADAQAAAATGQPALIGAWGETFAAHEMRVAQILVTNQDFEERSRYLNITSTLNRLLELGITPILNENDSVTTQEIRVGDNDRLAERVAHAAGAHEVILFSDVDGLYTADPSRDPQAVRLPIVKCVDDKIMALAGLESSSGMGSGGMRTKLEAARAANRAGIDLILVSGKYPHPLARLERGEGGTRFLAHTKPSAHKGWLAGRLKIRGEIMIDEGAQAALLRDGVSLLPAGAVRVQGEFKRGDVVDIVTRKGQALARGLCEYDMEEAVKICGKRSQECAAILGYAPRACLVHYDHMVKL